MVFIILLLMIQVAQADVVVVYNKDTKEVHSLSATNDAVIPAGMEVKTVKGNPEDYYAQADAKDFMFNGSKLSLNAKKVNDREIARQKKIENKQAVIASATEKLKALGLTDAEISAIMGR